MLFKYIVSVKTKLSKLLKEESLQAVFTDM